MPTRRLPTSPAASAPAAPTAPAPPALTPTVELTLSVSPPVLRALARLTRSRVVAAAAGLLPDAEAALWAALARAFAAQHPALWGSSPEPPDAR